MLFNSYIFILVFLPITWLGYHLLNHSRRFTLSKSWLVLASFFFYGYWKLDFIPLMLFSIIVNFGLGILMLKYEDQKSRKPFMVVGLLFNIGLLCYFKYINFFMDNLSLLTGSTHDVVKVLLPLGISYYSIQQIAYLYDTYEGVTTERNLLDYILFVVFFPKLIAGPIAHHEELLPQFKSFESKIFSSRNISMGLTIFCVGLFKKVVIADTLSGWTSQGFDGAERLHFFSAWGTSLAYTFQLYFDFSGYSDMAVGLARLFNIQLPQNFNSPLISKSINEFWSRWHITLSTFIRTYIFTPLIRSMPKATFPWSMLSMFLAMTIAGLWHGAAWTFVIYGAMHGLAIVINHTWKKKKKKMAPWLGWLITFNFVNISFIIFRAKDLKEAGHVLKGMLGMQGLHIPKLGIKPLLALKEYGAKIGPYMTNDENIQLLMIVLAFLLIFKGKNSLELETSYQPKTKLTMAAAALFVLCLFGMNRVSEFIYFNF